MGGRGEKSLLAVVSSKIRRAGYALVRLPKQGYTIKGFGSCGFQKYSGSFLSQRHSQQILSLANSETFTPPHRVTRSGWRPLRPGTTALRIDYPQYTKQRRNGHSPCRHTRLVLSKTNHQEKTKPSWGAHSWPLPKHPKADPLKSSPEMWPCTDQVGHESAGEARSHNLIRSRLQDKPLNCSAPEPTAWTAPRSLRFKSLPLGFKS